MVQTRSSSSSATPRATSSTPDTSAITATKPRRAAATAATSRAAMNNGNFSHTPSSVALAWLAVSLPLVAWDTGYVMLRPHSMPGGKWHKPLWGPYDLYGRVDHNYGLKQWDAGNGFTAAQAALNAVESLMYLGYLYLWRANGRPAAGADARRAVTGRAGAAAVLVAFAAFVMTVSKTVLYWLNESYSGFDNIGHNPWMDLFFLWIVPNGAWLIVPSYLIYTYGSEIIQAMSASAAESSVKAD